MPDSINHSLVRTDLNAKKLLASGLRETIDSQMVSMKEQNDQIELVQKFIQRNLDSATVAYPSYRTIVLELMLKILAGISVQLDRLEVAHEHLMTLIAKFCAISREIEDLEESLTLTSFD
ncbi:hypothetical protein HDE_05037 [Halotydeus destructor]|nr:hypothetical protein HDE_05037 [Halotydeus destructor]